MERVVKSIIRAYTVNPLRTVIKGSWGPWEIVPLFHTLHRLQRSFGGSSRRKERIRLWVVRSVRRISDGYFWDIDISCWNTFTSCGSTGIRLLTFFTSFAFFFRFFRHLFAFGGVSLLLIFQLSRYYLGYLRCALSEAIQYNREAYVGISAKLVLTATRMRPRNASYRTP